MNSSISLSIVILALYIIVQIVTDPIRSKASIYFLIIIVLVLVTRLPSNFLDISFLPFRHWAFLLGPLLLFYTYSSIGRGLSTKYLFHFTPVVLWWIVFIVFPSTNLQTQQVVRVYGMTNLISLISYGLLILLVLKNYTKALRQQYSFSDIFLEIKWLSYIAGGLVLVAVLLGLVITISSGMIQNKPLNIDGPFINPRYINNIHGIAILIFTFFFSIMAHRQNRVEFVILKPIDNNPGKDTHLPDSVNEENRHFNEVCDYMTKSKIYLESKLSLQQLSDEVNISRNDLSALINCTTGENFFHFVNGYRAREFRDIISEGKLSDYTLLAIGLECGFNSKSTFNVAVKKEFGQTPSQILKEIRPTL